ncbi:GspH/FimT family pseudopilin [Shewanella olleyana]|uniref:GspH/FimT family pseudopilin n=1 Tax=Shewanella olleyana TaxID=135626 RepID=UPI00200ECA98|nr:GspH/FimT family pseudopilin [Shewanella olleyana]MCL1068262.1 GspH/FimT family pseudopilin [Shewanella olleyana]
MYQIKKGFTKGFTLVELMVTLAVAAILIGIAVPSLTYLYESSRSRSAASSIESAFVFARNQAVSFGRRVTVCPGDGTGCTSDWIDGFTIFIDDDQNGVKDNNTDVLRYVDAFKDSDYIKASSSSNVTFNPDGLVSGSNAQTITYCPGATDSSHSRQVSLSASGRVQLITDGVDCTS